MNKNKSKTKTINNNKRLGDFAKQTGIHFKNPELFHRAMSHRSALGMKGLANKSNERLEYLGDAVLEFVVSKEIFDRFKKEEEGFLTKLRSALVCERNLSKVGKNLHLGDYIVMGRGEARSGGRKKSYLIANTVEALIGAVYLDQGLEIVSKFIKTYVISTIDEILKKKLYIDDKTALQEFVQAKKKTTPRYKTIKTIGPEHHRKFVVAVTILGKKYETGEGKTKQIAQEIAAKKTLARLQQVGFLD